MDNQIKLVRKSNVKFHLKNTPEFQKFKEEYKIFYTSICKIFSDKLKSGFFEGKRISPESGYIIDKEKTDGYYKEKYPDLTKEERKELRNSESITVTQLMRDPEWFKHICDKEDNKSLCRNTINWALNRINGYYKRFNNTYPTSINPKKYVYNSLRNYFKFTGDSIYFGVFTPLSNGKKKLNKINVPIDFKRSQLTHFEQWKIQNEDKDSFSANLVFDTNELIPIVDVEFYRQIPDNFLGIDINKSEKDFLTANYPIFNGSYVFPKPQELCRLEKVISAVNKTIKKSKEVPSHERRNTFLEINCDQELLPEKFRVKFSCVNRAKNGRRMLWLYQKDLHRKHKKLCEELIPWDDIMEYCKNHNLAYCHDDVQIASMDTFANDKIKVISEEKCRKNGIFHLSVNPANTSRTCPKCEYKHKSSSDTQFVCKRCKYTFGRHFVGAINIAKKGIGALNDCLNDNKVKQINKNNITLPQYEVVRPKMDSKDQELFDF